MPSRDLDFRTFAEAHAELDRLHRRGYEKLGNWDLAQICEHLAFFIDGTLDGHKIKVPWLFKVLFGRMVLKRILSQRRMKTGVFTPQKPLPEPGGDEGAAVDHLKDSLARLEKHQGEMFDSPFFGHLTPEQWRDLHLIHCAHHFGFLQPK